MYILDGSCLGREIYQVYWPCLVTSFGAISKVATEQEATLLLYLARHFATAGEVQEIIINC